jgi:hypothetical protein
MSSVESDILDQFLDRVAHAGELTSGEVQGLRELLASEKLPKAEAIVDLLTQPVSGSGNASN